MAGVEVEVKLDAASVTAARAALRTLVKIDTRRSLEQAGKEILALSDPLTPMKTGLLRESKYVFVEKEAGVFGGGPFVAQDWTLIVGYGDPAYRASEYAMEQHETQYMNYTTPGTGPYFLKQGLEMWARDAESKLGNAVKGEIAGVARGLRPRGVDFG